MKKLLILFCLVCLCGCAEKKVIPHRVIGGVYSHGNDIVQLVRICNTDLGMSSIGMTDTLWYEYVLLFSPKDYDDLSKGFVYWGQIGRYTGGYSGVIHSVCELGKEQLKVSWCSIFHEPSEKEMKKAYIDQTQKDADYFWEKGSFKNRQEYNNWRKERLELIEEVEKEWREELEAGTLEFPQKGI